MFLYIFTHVDSHTLKQRFKQKHPLFKKTYIYNNSYLLSIRNLFLNKIIIFCLIMNTVFFFSGTLHMDQGITEV